MIESIQIVEVKKRSTQGATRPFLCRGEDGELYWVKGTKAGSEALCSEWIAGRLGQEFGLPIPPFAQVEISNDLVEQGAFPEIDDLGAGFKFGSRHVDGAQEFDSTLIPGVSLQLQREILAFDVWIRNTDRTLSQPFGSSGNPNLLWEAVAGRLYVIDHNNAFLPDDMLRSTGFNNHVFYSSRQTLDAHVKAELEARMIGLLATIPALFAELPHEWLFLDEEKTVPIQMTYERMSAILRGVVSDATGFWRVLG